MAKNNSTSEIPRNLVLVGPTNVGKSTLFNKLTRTRKAIVCDRPGVTVDRHELLVDKTPVGKLLITDTGGVGPLALENPLGKEIERAAKLALKDAGVVLVIYDGTKEVGLEELEVATWLRSQKLQKETPVWVLVNKCDSKKFDSSSYYALGFDRLFEISSEHGTGIEELWEELQKLWGLIEVDEVDHLKPGPRVIVIGRPNVGKSTLLNAIIGDERHVVSDVAGTTRDVIETSYERHGMRWRLYDTAGMRKPGRQEREVEWVSREKIKDAAGQADVAILVIDSSEGVTEVDANIGGMALDYGLSVVIAYNKWDKMRGDKADDLMYNFERTKDLKLDFLQWCPHVNMSGLSGKGIPQLLKLVEKVFENRQQRVPTAKLNNIFETKFRLHSHPLGDHGRVSKFYYMSQVAINPPEFVVFTNLNPKAVHFSYERYVINSLRKEFGFLGTPLRVKFKEAHSNRR